MPRWMLLCACLTACGWGTVRSERGFGAPAPDEARCDVVQRDVPGEAVGGEIIPLAGEHATWLACVTYDGEVRQGVVVIDGLATDTPVEGRLMGTITGEYESKPSGPPTERPSKLSGVAATEHRLAYTFFGPMVRVLRYVRRGDTLYYAYVMGEESTMLAREAEHAAWLDAVRIDDLSR